MRSHLPRLLMTAALWLCAGAPWARGGDAVTGAQIVPDDVELLVVVDDGAGWRRGPGGRWLVEALRGATAASELDRAWRRLAAALKLDGDRAFDDLLGMRVVFARRGAKDAGEPSPWVVVSAVSRETERLIRDRLDAAPRRVAGGVTVLSLEDGAFWLATASGKSGATVMLGPSSASGLFDEMLPTLGRNAARSLLGSKMGEDIRGIQPGASVIVFSKRRDAEGRLVLSGLGAKRGAEGIEIGVLARSQLIAERVRDVGETSRVVFDAIAPHAYFAAVEWDVPDLLGAVGMDVPDVQLIPALEHFGGKEWIGARSVYLLGPGEGNGLVAAAAFQSKDSVRLAAPGDRLMASLAQSLWEQRDGGEDEAVQMDFEGKFPEATREVDLSRSEALGAVRALFREPSIAWVYRNAWWVVGLGDASVQRMVSALGDEAAAGDAERAAFLSVGVVRPSALVSTLRAGGVVAPPMLMPLVTAGEAIDSASWSLRRGDGGSIRGEVSVRFVPLAGDR